MNGRLNCRECEAMAPPFPGTPEWTAWVATVAKLRFDGEPTCADQGNEKLAHRLTDVKFRAHTRTQPYTTMPSNMVPLWNAMKAYAVEQVEPGRVTGSTGTNGET